MIDRYVFLALLAGLGLGATPAAAQLGTATTEAVYGGRVTWIDAVDLGSMTRLFIATESANSLFWTDVNPTDGATIQGSYGFATVGAFDADDGFGSAITRFAGHGASGHVYVVAGNALYGTDPTTTTRTTLAAVGVSTVLVVGNDLFYVAQGGGGGFTVEGGTLDGAGAYTAGGPGLSLSACGFTTAPDRLVVHPGDGTLYVFAQGTAGGTPTLCQSSDAYTAFSGSTTFGAVSVAGLPTESGQAYSAFGIGPDGRLFLGRTTGTAPGNKYVAYSDDNGATWTGFDTGVTGVAGDNIAAVGSGATYDVYFGTAVSNASGASGTWSQMPTVGSPTQPHANDGATVADPNNSTVVYLTTDVAFGMTPDQGQNLVDLNDGIVAVQVKDFDMDSGKTYGWLASKAGIFHVTDYNTPSVAWSHSFPMGDGAPYYAIAMDPTDATGQTAWAGNNRVYHTTDAGANWTRPFAIEDNGYQGGQFDFYSYVDALAVHPADPNVVFVGIHSPSSGVRGGIYYTEDGGTTWTQVSTTLGTTTYNAEVTDLLLVPGTGSDATVYVGSEYVSDGTTSAYGVKVVDYVAGSGTTFTNDMNGTSGLITNFGAADLARNAVDGALWACGQNSSGEPRVYRLASGSTTWELMPTAGLPASPGCTAITIGEETDGDKIPYIAIGEQIYYNPNNGGGDDETTGAWAADPALAYPTGTEINVLFWDELLVGTDTGFYGHSGTASLPVELVAFDAAADGEAVTLRWTTASETNNAGFEVQHLDGGAWQARAFVEGHGTSAAGHAYTYRLDGLEPGRHRFRLKQVDFDGAFSLSPEVEVSIAVPGAFSLGAAYPNPFNPQTTFRLSVARTQRVTVAVYDVLGRRVALLYRGLLAGGLAHPFRFDATGLPGGLYLIDVTGEAFHATRPVTLVK